MPTNAIEPSPSALIPGIWSESVRRTCRLTLTAFLLFGLVTTLGGCAVPTVGSKPFVSGFNYEPESFMSKTRISVVREVGLPDGYFVNDSDGTAFFVYQKNTSQKVVNLGLAILIAGLVGAGGAGGAQSGLDLSYIKNEYSCVLLRFGPDEQLVDYSVRNRSGDDHCTDEFASELAEGTRIERGDPLWFRFLDAKDQYVMALSFQDETKVSKWMCRAANRGNKYAQVYVGSSEPNVSKAFMWYSLATSNGNPTASYFRDDLAKKMTPSQIAEGDRLAKDWKPDPADCEAATSSSS